MPTSTASENVLVVKSQSDISIGKGRLSFSPAFLLLFFFFAPHGLQTNHQAYKAMLAYNLPAMIRTPTYY